MNNADLILQLQSLTEVADALRQDLARSEDMPALAMAPAPVRCMELNKNLGKLAKDARKSIAPLFGRDKPDDGDRADDKPKRPRGK